MTRRILHVIADAQFGGAQWYLTELARVQRARGDAVTIATGGAGPLSGEYERAASRFLSIASLRRAVGPHDIAAARAISRLAVDYDVVHAHASKALAASVMLPHPRPVVWSAHGYDSAHAEFSASFRPALGWAKAFLVRRASAVSAASLNVAAKIVHAGVPRDRVRVIYTGVSRERFSKVPPPPNTPPMVFGAAGRLVGIKGFDVFVDAARIVLGARDDVRFVLYGDGPKEAELRQRMAAAGVGDAFTLSPATSDLPSAFSGMHVVVVPSRLDSFPLVPCEAMVAGRPIVATRVGGLPEAFADGVHGLLVPPGDARALADAMIQLAGDPARVERMGRDAHAYASERYSWERVATEYDALYELALAT